MPVRPTELRVFSGNAHPELAAEVVRHMGSELGQSRVDRLSDGETRVEIGESVRGKDVFIVQPTSPPVNETTMELLIMVDAFRRATTFDTLLISGLLNKNPSHRFSRSREEMPSALELLSTDQSQISLMNKSGCIESMSGPLIRHLGGREFAKFFVNQRE